ncbi:hypothetical protein MGYG_01100 [Nannizzia gypsea CBS 118893]|uniref:Serine/threonine-protein kinase ppk6 n=1 Tax=Arthroderma gypseum (strain ATCC MYA-4604 / CBS 118893) TaxID=535722 RepID=E5QYI7_ARTGP|nr:hypothetical protein MGYG_01100 [Nannizzia gypsea CBS 118893]EFQ98063.1 hypothetical protein MGYG_01100 [Nannizzia gypsea CBS 118893]
MSADLFAAFGQPDSASQPTTASNNANLSRTGPVKGNKGKPGALLDTDVDLRDATAPQASIFESWQPPALERASSDAEVLFDATTEPPPDSNGQDDEDGDEDDEWGEFESAEQLPVAQQEGASLCLQHQVIDIDNSFESSATPQKPSSQQAAKSQPQPHNVIDLLSIDDDLAKTTTSCSTGDRPVRHQTGQISGEERLVAAPPKNSKGKGIEVEEAEEDDDWGEFIDGAEDAATKTQQQPIPTSSSGRSKAKAVSPEPGLSMEKTRTRKAETTASSVRPTNIPPPSILLPLFPPLLEESRRKAAGYARRKGDGSTTSSLQPDEEFANQLVSDIRTMAHVVSGRHLRWKRDQILSQSTKIGPARSGRSGGMKLSSVNKSENVKEEQEVMEVVEAWKRCGSLLNSVVTSIGRNPMPALSLSMQVRTAAIDEGALKSAHACALCGLKREERVPRVDDQVSDSFGEWWLDHWGHADCEAFWKSNAANLDHR